MDSNSTTLDDYLDTCNSLTTQLTRLHKKSNQANEADRASILQQSKKILRELKEELIYFKQELFNCPKGPAEAEFRRKYEDYMK